MALCLPLGLFWGSWLVFAIGLGLALSFVLVGIPMLVVVMLIWRRVAAWGARARRAGARRADRARRTPTCRAKAPGAGCGRACATAPPGRTSAGSACSRRRARSRASCWSRCWSAALVLMTLPITASTFPEGTTIGDASLPLAFVARRRRAARGGDRAVRRAAAGDRHRRVGPRPARQARAGQARGAGHPARAQPGRRRRRRRQHARPHRARPARRRPAAARRARARPRPGARALDRRPGAAAERARSSRRTTRPSGARRAARPRARHAPGDARRPWPRRRPVRPRRPLPGAGRRARVDMASARRRPSRPPRTSSSPRRSPTSRSTPAPPRPRSRSTARAATGSSSRSPTTATAAPTPRAASASTGSATASPRSTAALRRQPRRRADDLIGGAPMRVVIAEDSVLLREGLVRLLADAGDEVVAAVGDADALLDAVARPPAGPGDRRRAHAADAHRRGPARRARDPAPRARTSASSCSPSTSRSATRPSCSPAAAAGSATCSRTASPTSREFVDAAAPRRRRRHGARPRGRRAAARPRRDARPARRAHPARARGARADGRGPLERRRSPSGLVVSEGAVEKHVTPSSQARPAPDRRRPPPRARRAHLPRRLTVAAPVDYRTSCPVRGGCCSPSAAC